MLRLDLTLLAAVGIDAALGEPRRSWHPVVWMGRAVAWFERRAPWGHPGRERRYGAALALGLPLASAALAWTAARSARGRGRLAGFLVTAWLLKTTFAIRDLERSAGAVADALAVDDLGRAREAAGMLVSRPVAELDRVQVASAAVESVAESTADSFVGPWLAYAVLGLPGAAAYRAVSTLDSMLGYRGRYEHVGRAAARLDDALNFVPSRVAALCLALGAPGARADGRAAWRAARRDHGLTESPNAGWPMAAMAGALGVALEKPGHYRLNPAGRPPDSGDIARSLRVMRRAAGWALLGALLVRAVRRAWR